MKPTAAQGMPFGMAMGLAILTSGAAVAAAADGHRADRQAMLSDLLTVVSSQSIAQARVACLSGDAAKDLPRLRAAGATSLPDVADECVTVLIRSARDGQTTPLQDATRNEPTPASAFDNGFMQGYAHREPLPQGLPTMTVLKPVAERCLTMQEQNVELCAAVGSAFGRRAAAGEAVVAS